MLALNRPAGNMRDLGFNETNSHIDFPSKSKSVPASIKSKSIGVQGPRSCVQHKFHQPKV